MVEPRIQATITLPGYEVLSELGRGGVSTVYLARHELLEREVAIKVMAPALTLEEGFNKRFIREGQTIARLEHPGIVRVYDVSVADYRPYIAMEYLPGGSLKDRMRHAIPPADALSLLRAIADSLGYAHDLGICHRDVKPENILFRHNGEPVLTDFGIAKSDAQDTALTSIGVVVGTPRYISPEQAQGYGSDARSDIYALGVILFEMLTGRPPYDVKGSMSLLYAHINDPIPKLPEELVAYQGLLDDLLAKEPDRRTPDCETLVAQIDSLLDGGSPVGGTPMARNRRAGNRWYARAAPRTAVLGVIAVTLLGYWLWSQDHLQALMPEKKDDLHTTVARLLPDRTPPAVEFEPAVEVEPAGLDKPVVATVEKANEEQKVLEQTDPQKAFERARALYAGNGSGRNSSAAALYREAATVGHALAQYHLGVMYGNGEGVERDEKRAVQWLTRAAQSGLRDAKYNLILAKIFGPEPDMSEAARIARDLAEQEYAPVYRILGWMYNTGTGVDSSFTQSVRWGVKTMMGDVTGRANRPERVVQRWERRLDIELSKIWGSEPPEASNGVHR